MKKNHPRIVIVFLCSISLALSIGFAAFIGNKSPSNVLFPVQNENTTRTISQTFLQGWGFFTRDAREHRTRIALQNNNGDFYLLERKSVFSPLNTFGFSRAYRIGYAEDSYLDQSVNQWQECSPDKTIPNCLKQIDAFQKVSFDPLNYKTLCNRKIYLLREDPIPFAYRKLTTDKTRHAAGLEIICQ